MQWDEVLTFQLRYVVDGLAGCFTFVVRMSWVRLVRLMHTKLL